MKLRNDNNPARKIPVNCRSPVFLRSSRQRVDLPGADRSLQENCSSKQRGQGSTLQTLNISRHICGNGTTPSTVTAEMVSLGMPNTTLVSSASASTSP